jgi:glucose-1-phosphate thymidylyltransferase
VAAGSDIDFSTISDSIINADCKVSHMNLHLSLLGDSVTLIGVPRRMNIGDHSLIVMDQ